MRAEGRMSMDGGSAGAAGLPGAVAGGAGLRRLGPLAVVLLALSAGACHPLDDATAWIFGRSMRNQPSFDPYEDPKLPAEGSLPFAAGNYPARVGQVNVGQAEAVDYDLPHFTAADMARGPQAIAAGLVNPVPATPESLARGEEMYQRFCAICHGPQGLSAEAAMMPHLPMMAAFNLAMGAALNQTDGYLYGMIRVGRGIMPPYGHQVPHFDRWHIVNYIRQLQAQAGAPPAPAPADPAEPPAAEPSPADTPAAPGSPGGA